MSETKVEDGTVVSAEPALPVNNIEAALPFLRRPFTPGAVKWKVQSTWPKGKPAEGAIVVGYIDARLVSARLNKVVGGNWSEKTRRVEGAVNALLGELTVFDQTHVDLGLGQGHSDEMKMKAVHSDALKRPAVRFGIGESLYAMPEIRIQVTEDGGEASDGRPTIRRRSDGKAGYLTEKVEAFLRERYKAWLKSEANTFGEPLDHGDAEEGSVGYEDSGAEEAGERSVAEPLSDEEGKALIAQAEALCEEIQALDPTALESFDNALKQRWHAHDLMRDFIGKLEGLRSDIEHFLALQEEARGTLGEDAAKKAIEKAMRRGSRSERVEMLEKALAEADNGR